MPDDERHPGERHGMPLVFSLLRHAEASPSGPGGDAERRLTARGEAVIRGLAERLAREGWRPAHVFTSRLKRARDTARILLLGLAVEARGEVLEELNADADPASVLDAVAAHGARQGEVLIVGHQPQLGSLVGLLTGKPRALSPGELIRIRCAPGSRSHDGRVTLTLPPEETGP